MSVSMCGAGGRWASDLGRGRYRGGGDAAAGICPALDGCVAALWSVRTEVVTLRGKPVGSAKAQKVPGRYLNRTSVCTAPDLARDLLE